MQVPTMFYHFTLTHLKQNPDVMLFQASDSKQGAGCFVAFIVFMLVCGALLGMQHVVLLIGIVIFFFAGCLVFSQFHIGEASIYRIKFLLAEQGLQIYKLQNVKLKDPIRGQLYPEDIGPISSIMQYYPCENFSSIVLENLPDAEYYQFSFMAPRQDRVQEQEIPQEDMMPEQEIEQEQNAQQALAQQQEVLTFQLKASNKQNVVQFLEALAAHCQLEFIEKTDELQFE